MILLQMSNASSDNVYFSATKILSEVVREQKKYKIKIKRFISHP